MLKENLFTDIIMYGKQENFFISFVSQGRGSLAMKLGFSALH